MAKVIIYTTTNCIHCALAKRFFQKHHIKFTEYNIERDKNAMEQLLKIVPGDGVPVVIVNGKVFSYFDEEEIKEALKIKKVKQKI